MNKKNWTRELGIENEKIGGGKGMKKRSEAAKD
jgi:hypothetical protein